MIPNSNLISGVVKNISLRDASGRVVITIGVAYGSDPERVRQILLDCARAHPQVLADPPPYVVFQDFGASALTFELDCFIVDNRLHNTVVSDLRFAILKRMNEEGIEIPFPQQDLNLRDWPKIEKALLGLIEAAAASSRARPSAQSGETHP
jgi:small-conductance mechanosensitive channel